MRLSSFTLDYPGDRILFDLDTGSLDNAFGFPRDRWPNLISLYHDRAVSSYWIEASPEIWFRPSMRIIPGLTERLSGMMNLKVTNQQGESLGEIKDYVITTDGRVPYTAIDFGGLFDLSGRWYFAPTGSMTVDLLNTLAFFNIDRESLKEVPKFDSDKVPNTKNPNWDADILLFWKHLLNPKTTLEYVGPWEQMKTNNSNALLFSRLMGYQVDGSNRKPLGEVDDLLLDIGNAGVRYIAVSSGGLLDLGERMTLVPFSHVQLLIGTRRLLLDVEPDAFRNAPGFKPTGWPDTSKPGWNSEIDRYWKDR
jgi:sporulation protein YlmC with PRC-barrel domain